MKKIYISVLAIVAASISFAQVGKLDKSFGNDGIVITPLSTSNDVAYDIAIQDDNKLIVVGSGDLQGSYFQDAIVIRYLPDGKIDSSFGINGLVTPKLGSRTARLESVIIQQDGKILAGGTSHNIYSGYDFTIIRLNKNGSADKSFGTNGKVITAFGADDWLSELKLLPNGKILAIGNSGFFSHNTTCIARYNSDGLLDNSFGDGGKIQLSENAGVGNSIDVLPNGNYVVGGTYFGSSFSRHGFLKSITTSGVLDASFGNNGTTILPEFYSIINVVALPNGKILCGGSKSFDNSFYKDNFALYRFNANGLFDNSFGTNGIVTTVLDSVNNLDHGGRILVAPNGQIVQCGSSKGLAALLRYMPNGTLNGFVTTDAGGDSSYLSGMAFEKDYRKLAVCGNILTGSVELGQDVAVLRYHTARNQNEVNEEHRDLRTIKQSSISIYPNPVKGRLMLEGLDERYSAKISLADQSGNVVYSEASRNVQRKELNVEMLRPGIYFLQVEENGQIYKFNIIKE